MELITQTPGKNIYYLQRIASKINAGQTPEPLTCDVIGVISADRTGGLFCSTPCGRDYRVTVEEKKSIERDTKDMLGLWCNWARNRATR